MNNFLLLDVIYFRDYENSPRKAVLGAIDRQDKVLDLCTGTATNTKFIKKDLYEYFRNYGLEIVKEIHCDYSKVLIIRSVNSEVVI